MPKLFEPAMRIDFEDNLKGFHNAVHNRIKTIENKARVIREEGRNPRVELADEISKLKADVSYTTQVRAQELENIVEGRRQEYREKIEKNPNLQLLKVQEAQLKINSMDDNELKDWAAAVGNETVTPTAEEASAALTRLKDAERHYVKDRVAKDHIDQPWLQDPDTMELYRESEMLTNTPPGNVIVDGMAIDVEHLIDFDDELNQEV